MISDITRKFKMRMFEISDCTSIAIKHFRPIRTLENSEIEIALPFGFKESFLQSFVHCAEFMIEWHEQEHEDPTVGGSINISKLSSIALKHSSSNYDPKYYDDDDPIRDFHVVDEFSNEAGVGIYSGEHATNSLYYFAIDERPEYLGLDFLGYMEMLKASFGFLYWQKAILAIRNKQDNLESEKLKTHLPMFFPNWSWEEFVAKYESVKIEEEGY